MKDLVELTVQHMGEWLELRRRNNHQTTLLLGSRAGALYRSLPFYHYCQQHTSHNLYTHSPMWSFRECYHVLLQRQLGERELHTLLQDAFKNISNLLGPYDLHFAELVKKGYFREVISTNIDDIIEQALHYAGLIESNDFEVLIPEKQLLTQERGFPYRLTKVFGDWHSREYTIYNRQSYLINNKALNQYLRSILHGHVLAVGLDPLWDSAILPFLHGSLESLWFVNEQEDIIYDQQIASILNQTEVGVVIDNQNSRYKNLFSLLYQQLCMEVELSSKTVVRKENEPDLVKLQSPEVSTSSSQKKAIHVMYIYCDDDLGLMQQLWEQLYALKDGGLITEWHRGLLAPGDYVQLTHERELRCAQLILIGFSPGFFSSEYYDQALQALKLSHSEHGETVTLVPILLRPVANWKQTSFGAIHPVPHEGKTLSEMTSRERNRALSKIAGDIHQLVQRLQKDVPPSYD